MKSLVFSTLALLLCACGSPATSTAAFNPADMTHTERDTAFDQALVSLNLEDPSYQLSYKDSGTSLGLKIKRGDVKVGKWLPKNEGADPEAQVVSYYLGRYLGMGDLVIPAGYHTVHGRALAQFRSMLETAAERIRVRAVNQAALLNALARNPNSMEGVFTQPVDSFELASLVDTGANNGMGTLRQDTAISALIRVDGPVPSAERELDLGAPKIHGKRPSNNELALARELSKIMVLDVLCGQFDRFSGGNLEGTVDSAQKLHFIARDNGGAGMGPGNGNPNNYYQLVSRFDRAQISQVRRIALELAADPAGAAAFFHIRSNPKTFASRVSSLLAYVDRLVASYGESRVYFAD